MTDGATAPRTCAWCAASAPDDATVCPSCGAALAQRESLGGVQIAGLTAVDPALLAVDGRPMRIPTASPTQGLAGGVMLAAMAGGPVGLAAIGGLAVVGAAEYGLAGRRGRDGAPSLDELGRPSEVALQAIERMTDGGDPTPETAAEPTSEPPAGDPWRDLPRPSTVEPPG